MHPACFSSKGRDVINVEVMKGGSFKLHFPALDLGSHLSLSGKAPIPFWLTLSHLTRFIFGACFDVWSLLVDLEARPLD